MQSFQSTLPAITEQAWLQSTLVVPRVFSTFQNGAIGRGAHCTMAMGMARGKISGVSLVLHRPNDIHFGCKTFESIYLIPPSIHEPSLFAVMYLTLGIISHLYPITRTINFFEVKQICSRYFLLSLKISR